MLVLKANREQEDTFRKIIQAMGAQVVWNGRFFVMGDRLILEGVVRSLIFHYDIQKMEVELIDLPEEETEWSIEDIPQLQDLITMTIYVFEKWGILKWIEIGLEMGQLNQIFGELLCRYGLEADFSTDQIQFLKAGIRITYEDAIEAALRFESTVGKRLQTQWNGPRLQMPAIGQYQKEDRSDSKAKAATEEIAVPQAGTHLQKHGIGAEQTDTKAAAAAAKPLGQMRDEQAAADRIEKYQARISVLDRLSELQKKALHRDIRNDRLLREEEKSRLLTMIEDHEYERMMQAVDREFSDPKNQTYAYVKKVIKKVEKEDFFEKIKNGILEKLHALERQFGAAEVQKIMEQVPNHVERDAYQELMQKLAPYEAIDISPYKEKLGKMRETLEIKEISNLLVQSPKETRSDYVALLAQIEEGNFALENAAPYRDRIREWIYEFDEKRIQKLLTNVPAMEFDTAAAVYAKIKRESLLPELREFAAGVLSNRLTDIRLQECAQLVAKMRQDLADAVKENERYHFYPAQQLMRSQADPDEMRIINTALSSYAQDREPFEYPVMVMDTSKEGSGSDGMLLTRENLFYSTRMNGYKIRVSSIKSIQVSSGLLNRRLMLEESNGARHKLPYLAEANEMQDWAAVLEKFVRDLQKLPQSALLENLQQELKDASYCERCGCVYHGMDACPQCGLAAGAV